MRKPKGHVRKRPFGYEIAVPIGRDPITKRYQYRYEYAGTPEEAEAARERMVADVAAGRAPKTEATFGQLIDEVLEVISLDFTTLGMYQGYIERTIRPALAEYGVRHLEQHPDLLDKLYAALGPCRKLGGGGAARLDHRPARPAHGPARGQPAP